MKKRGFQIDQLIKDFRKAVNYNVQVRNELTRPRIVKEEVVKP